MLAHSATTPPGSGSSGLLPELVSYLDGLPEPPHILFDGQYRIPATNVAYRAQISLRTPYRRLESLDSPQ